MNTQPDDGLNSTTWISVPNPDGIFGMPIFEGTARDAFNELAPGIYTANTGTDVDFELIVTQTHAHIDLLTQGFWCMDAVLQEITAAGAPAVMENMGGGNLAIATGRYDTKREAFTGVLAGTVFQHPDGNPVAHRNECYIGPDNTETQGDTVPPATTHRELVRMIVEAHNQQVTGEVRTK